MEQVAVRAVELHRLDAEPRGTRRAPSANAVATRTSPSRSSAIGGCSLSTNGWRRRHGLPPVLLVGPDLRAPSHGTRVDALRPACASWIAIGMSDQRRTLSSVSRQRRFRVVRPQAEVLARDSSFRQHRCRLDRQ